MAEQIYRDAVGAALLWGPDCWTNKVVVGLQELLLQTGGVPLLFPNDYAGLDPNTWAGFGVQQLLEFNRAAGADTAAEDRVRAEAAALLAPEARPRSRSRSTRRYALEL